MKAIEAEWVALFKEAKNSGVDLEVIKEWLEKQKAWRRNQA